MGISSVKVLLNTLGDDESRNNYRAALKDYFRPHLDDLCADCHRRFEQNPLRILDCKVDHEKEIMENAPKLSEYLNEESKEYFSRVLSSLDYLGIPYQVEDRLVRGLDYYTHTVFEVESTREESGAQATIFGGGRYDHLVEYFGGPELSGIGFAIGIERLIALAEEDEHAFKNQDKTQVYVIGLGNVEKEALKIATTLRNEGFLTDVNLVARSLKSQFKSAERQEAKYIVILGEDEVKQNEYNVKKSGEKDQLTLTEKELIELLKKWEGK